jgi:XTP/dITP diphosphohydrolase
MPSLARTLVVATHNVKKAGEMITILSARFPSVQLLTLADFDGAPEPDETGTTYADNATLKAESAARFTEFPSIADDAGLEIDAMGGEPGLFSRRFAGEETPFPEKMRLILERLRDVPEEQRTARFRCAVAFSVPTKDGVSTRVFTATCEGRIAFEPSGMGGFGYDPIFFLPERSVTMAELKPEEKHRISHRGKVLREFGEFYAGWLGQHEAAEARR